MYSTPVKTFICYAHQDRKIVEDMLKHLKPLERKKNIEIWDDGQIQAGQDWDTSIKEKLETAQLILLFVSVDFIDSEYIEKTELKTALERHAQQEVTIVPIIVRACSWQDYFDIGKFMALPKNAKPIISAATRIIDDVLHEVTLGIKKVALEILKRGNAQYPTKTEPVSQKLNVAQSEIKGKRLTQTTSTNSNNVPTQQVPQPEMELVNGGVFVMEKDFSVILSDYFIGKYPVTQKFWKDIMGNNPSRFIESEFSPVEMVTWDDTQEFIEKLNELFPNQYYRLPTEAEWAFAAQGGNLSKGYEFAGSNMVEEVAWFYKNAIDKTQPVGLKKKNELGIYDMSGNVWEWCYDWYDDFPSTSKQDYSGPPSGSYRVIRGGSWLNYPQICRISFRNGSAPDNRNGSLGFRLARTL